MNTVNLLGKIINLKKNHTINEKTFYKATLIVTRKAGKEDWFTIIVNSELITDIKDGDIVVIEGNLRNCPSKYRDDTAEESTTFVYVESISLSFDVPLNSIEGKGTIKRIFLDGQTSSGKAIKKFVIECPRKDFDLSYKEQLVCCAWGSTCRSPLIVEGQKVSFKGRLEIYKHTNQDSQCYVHTEIMLNSLTASEKDK